MRLQPLLFFVVMILLSGRLLPAGVISREEALHAAFPEAKIESQFVFLTDAEVKEISRIAGSPVVSALVAAYTAVSKDGKQVGRAYLDTHVVRTKKESLLVILHPDGKVKRVEIVAFLEPPDYIPGDRWYEQFEDQALSDKLNLDADIRSVTGATLTAHATTAAVRRALATDQVLAKRKKK